MIAKIGQKAEMKNASELMAFFEKVGERGNPTEANQLLGAPKIELAGWIQRKKESVGKIHAG